MTLEIITISVAISIIFVVYFARIKSGENKTFLFSESFLQRADDVIFGSIKFVFKMYSLLSHNIIAFLSGVPHAVLDLVHKISHAVAQYTHALVEKFKNEEKKK